MNVNFQIQGHRKDGDSYHSSGKVCSICSGCAMCSSVDTGKIPVADRKLMHEFLDEFLDKLNNTTDLKDSGDVFDNPHFVVFGCLGD